MRYNLNPMSSAHTTTIRASLMRLDRHSGASRGSAPQVSPFAELHDVAARQDGIVKILTGLIIGVFSLGFAAVGVVSIHALIKSQEVTFWAFVIGLPGMALSLVGLILVAWGAVKAVSGRGNG